MLPKLLLAYMSARCRVNAQHQLPTLGELSSTVILGSFFTKDQIEDVMDDLIEQGKVWRYAGGYFSDHEIKVM